MSAPFGVVISILTESWEFDIMHRRAGGDARPRTGGYGHGDAHKYCPLGRCGTRPGPYGKSTATVAANHRSAKITAWRIAKAKANRAYLEREVYDKPTKGYRLV